MKYHLISRNPFSLRMGIAALALAALSIAAFGRHASADVGGVAAPTPPAVATITPPNLGFAAFVPDLTVISGTLTPDGNQYRVTFVVRNQGNAPAGPFAVAIKGSPAYTFATVFSAGLAAGQLQTFSVLVDGNSSCTQIINRNIWVDSGFQVNESNEGNNHLKVSHYSPIAC